MNIEKAPRESQRQPLIIVSDALASAGRGIDPYVQYGNSAVFREALLNRLGLNTSIKDGLGLMQRFTDGRLIRNFRKVVSVQAGIHSLLQLGLEQQTNPYQEQLGKDLAAIAARQFEREDTVCPGVADMVLLAPERFLGEFPGVKERVFEREIDQTVGEMGGKISEGRIISHAILTELGFTPPGDTPSGAAFANAGLAGFIRLGFPPETELLELTKSQFLAGTSSVIESFWVQSPEDPSPHRLVQPAKRRR